MEILREPEFWIGVGFVAVLALLVWKGAPRMIGAVLDKRAAVIAAELAEARRLREDAAAMLVQYREKAAGAEQETAAILAEARADIARFAQESRAALKLQIERRTQAAQDRIAQAETAAMNEIRTLAADAAVAAAQKLIAARMDEKRAGALIDASIKDLGKLN